MIKSKIQSHILYNTCQTCGKLKVRVFTKEGAKKLKRLEELNGRCKCGS